MKKTVLAFFILSFLSISTGRAQRLESLYFTNSPVTEDDQIGIGAEMYFTASSCAVDKWRSEIDEDGYLRVTVEYFVGLNTQPCSLTDTVYINPVPAGDYTLIYQALSVSGTFSDYDTLTLSVDIGTGLSSKSKPGKGIDIFPNPANGILNIKLSGETANIEAMYLRDLSGAIIKSFPRNARTLNLTDFPSGMYFLTFVTDEGSNTQRVVLR